MTDLLNKYGCYIVPTLLLVIILLNVLYVNTGFRYMAMYNFIAKKYYRVCFYINIFEEHGKLSFGRLILATMMALLVKWLWVFKDPGIMFFGLIIFFGGYVFFNKPILFNAMASRVKGMIDKVKNTVGIGGDVTTDLSEPVVVDGGESPDDPEDV